MDAEQIWRQAQDENTSPETLAELAKSKDKEILRLVAGNPNTLVETLEKLGEEFPDAIVNNPIFDLLLLENPESKFILLSLAGASTTSVEKLKKLAEHQDRDIRVAVAANHNTPTNIVNNLFKSDWEMKQSVSKNKNISKELLCNLAKENSCYVCSTIAQREDLPEEVITILMKSGRWTVGALFPEKCDFYRHLPDDPDSWHVRNVLASNPSMPKNIINKLIRDNDHHVRAAVAARKDISGKQAIFLKHDLSQLVRRKLAENPNVSNAIKKLIAEEKENVQKSEKIKLALEQIKDTKTPTEVVNNLVDEVPQVRRYVAGSKNISAENAFVLAHDSSTEVIEKLYTNANIPIEIAKLLDKYHEYNQHYVYRKCSTFNKFGMSTKYFKELTEIEIPEKIVSRIVDRKNSRVNRLIATNRNISISIFNRLLKNTSFDVCLGFIENSNTPSEILKKLSVYESHCIREGVAKHVNTSIKTLDILKDDRNISVREKVAQNPKISPEIIEELARDSVPLVRRAIAENLKTPAAILDKLKSDRSKYVRQAVAENQNISLDTLRELLNDKEPKIVMIAKNNLEKRENYG